MSNKPKCPVFGCTIPRGIPHEHPAGVSAVMRDPVAPLSATERAELERLRADAAVMRNAGMNAVVIGTKMHEAFLQSEALRQFCEEHPATYVVPADAPMVPGRKLRDSLMLVGMMPSAPRSEVDSGVRAALLEAGRIRRETADIHGMDFGKEHAPAPRRSFVSTTARVAFWIVLAVTVAIWIFAGVKS